MSILSPTQSTSNLLDNLLQDTAYIVSDGSFYPTTRTYSCAWIIFTSDGIEWIQGRRLHIGCKENQDLYRSEFGGQLGVDVVASAVMLPDGSKLMIKIVYNSLSELS